MCWLRLRFEWKVKTMVCDTKTVLIPFQECEEWWAARVLWVPRDTASSVRRYKCRQTEAPARKDKLELNTVC